MSILHMSNETAIKLLTWDRYEIGYKIVAFNEGNEPIDFKITQFKIGCIKLSWERIR